jgi:hypothetical protein
VILSAILESCGREVARARAHGSIVCGLTTQLVMRVGPSRVGLSHVFDGVARGTGVARVRGAGSVARLSQSVWVDHWVQVMDIWSITIGDK